MLSLATSAQFFGFRPDMVIVVVVVVTPFVFLLNKTVSISLNNCTYERCQFLNKKFKSEDKVNCSTGALCCCCRCCCCCCCRVIDISRNVGVIYCLGLKTPRLYWDRQFVKFPTVDFVNCSLRLLGIEDRKLEFGEKHRKE